MHKSFSLRKVEWRYIIKKNIVLYIYIYTLYYNLCLIYFMIDNKIPSQYFQKPF